MPTPSRAPRRRALAAVAAAALGLTGCSVAAAATPAPATAAPAAGNDAAAVLSPIAVFPLAPAAPVLGADNLVHLAYELVIANQSASTVTLTSVSTLDAGHGDAVVTTVEGPALAAALRPSGPGTGTALAPGGSGYLFLDATLAADAPVPTGLRHHFAMTLTGSGAAQQVAFGGVPVTVSPQEAVEVAPPLRGGGWIVGNGCCVLNAHRGATLSIDGTVHVAERFAIDFVQVDAAGHLYTGDPAATASWPYFGDDILSVADGTVVSTQDGQPEQVPGALPAGQTVQTAGGNNVVVDIGDGRFAFYAHLQPGSLTVHPGDHVRTGDVLGKLGNTGNTDAPHLHFHVMDGPSPLLSNSLPYVFTAFTGQGRATGEEALAPPFAPVAATVAVDPAALAGAHHRQLPLNLQVVDFG
ncbi:M23 family metallopeptidase [Pseudonocardia sp. GCM10023141]|uniref:M23 family metallopeptidase n=1 Tax=Pseudonocardia sp. GCM10023141 TaxID=3252653 RepID=UPI003615A7BE